MIGKVVKENKKQEKVETNRERAFNKALEDIKSAELGVLDNKYTFSKRVLDIQDKTSLAQTTLSISKLVRAERTWVLSRLKKIDMVDEILTDESEKQRAKEYLLSSVLNMGIVSRTDDAWLIKDLIRFEQEIADAVAPSGKSTLTMTDDELDKAVPTK